VKTQNVSEKSLRRVKTPTVVGGGGVTEKTLADLWVAWALPGGAGWAVPGQALTTAAKFYR
jgi:hypothetical protein